MFRVFSAVASLAKLAAFFTLERFQRPRGRLNARLYETISVISSSFSNFHSARSTLNASVPLNIQDTQTTRRMSQREMSQSNFLACMKAS